MLISFGIVGSPGGRSTSCALDVSATARISGGPRALHLDASRTSGGEATSKYRGARASTHSRVSNSSASTSQAHERFLLMMKSYLLFDSGGFHNV